MNVVIPSGNMTRQKAHHSRHARPSSSRRHHSNGHTRPSYAMSVEEHFNVVEVGAQQQQNPVADVFEGASFSGRLNDRHAVAGHPMADLTSTQYELAPMNQDVVVHRDFHHHPTSEGHDPPRHHLQEQCNENATPRAVLSSGGWSTQSLGYPDPSPVRWYYPKPDAEVPPAYGPGTLADDPPAPIRSESDYLYSTGTANTGRPESFAPGAVQYSYELSRQRHDTNTVPYLPTLGEGVSSSRSSLEVTNGSAVGSDGEYDPTPDPVHLPAGVHIHESPDTVGYFNSLGSDPWSSCAPRGSGEYNFQLSNNADMGTPGGCDDRS